MFIIRIYDLHRSLATRVVNKWGRVTINTCITYLKYTLKIKSMFRCKEIKIIFLTYARSVILSRDIQSESP